MQQIIWGTDDGLYSQVSLCYSLSDRRKQKHLFLSYSSNPIAQIQILIHKEKGGEDWEVGQKASKPAIHATNRQTDTTIS